MLWNTEVGIGIETKKMRKFLAFTGISTKAGELLIVRIKPSNQPIDLVAGKTHKMFYALHHGAILEVMGSGVVVLE